jgi:hypothetical protein
VFCSGILVGYHTGAKGTIMGYLEITNKLYKEYGITHYSPIYELDDKEKVKQIAISLGLPPRSMDPSCLFEERALDVVDDEVKEYLNGKIQMCKDYIQFLVNLYKAGNASKSKIANV